MDFNPKISIYKNARSPKPTDTGSIKWALELIASDKYKKESEAIRTCKTKDKRDELKKRIDAVTFSGHFKYRDTEEANLIEYSGFICQDIDKLSEEALFHLRSLLSQDETVFAFFVSPSGKGLKILFRTDNSDYTKHKEYWCAVEQYLNKTYNQECDQLPKSYASLCFLSYDPDVYVNEGAIVIDSEFVKMWDASPLIDNTPKPKLPKQYNVSASLEDRFLQIAHDTVIRRFQPAQGSYNGYINLFSLFCLRYDIDENTIGNAVAANCGWSAPDKDDIAIIKSVFSKFGNERGVWKDDYSGSGLLKNIDTSVPSPAQTKRTEKPSRRNEKVKVNDDVKFWYAIEKLDKKGDPVFDQETGEVKVDYKLSFDNAMDFLQNNGFYKLYEGESYRLIRIEKEKNQVDVVLDIRLEEFMLDYLKSQRNTEFNRVREIFRQSVTKFCNTRQFAGLDYYTPIMRKDTATTAYVYFKNCYFEISKDGAKQGDYRNMDGFIWKKQLINHDYTPVDFNSCDFQLFLLLAITGKRKLDELDEVERKKYDATITGIGYLLHKYKDPSVAKAVLGVDKKTRASNEEMNGGSGKSIIGRAIGKMLNMFLIDGQNFRFDDQFAFDGVSPDTQFINFNDVNGSFNFQRMFGMITEDFTYRGLYAKRVSVPYEDSPKFYISTNHTLRGDGESVLRRQHIIEFTDFFNSRHAPLKELGRMMFSGWDALEWSRFFSFFMHCISTFLEVGLVNFPIENYGLRKLLEWNNGMGSDINDYLNETIKDKLRYSKTFDKGEIFQGFLKIADGNMKLLTSNAFTKQTKLWAKINKLDINAGMDDTDFRDRRNGIDYLTFTPMPGDGSEPDVFEKAIAAQEAGERFDVV